MLPHQVNGTNWTTKGRDWPAFGRVLRTRASAFAEPSSVAGPMADKSADRSRAPSPSRAAGLRDSLRSGLRPKACGFVHLRSTCGFAPSNPRNLAVQRF